MLQLVIDGMEMPESKKGGYTAIREPLSVDLEMISGRLVRELRGYVWRISYQYGYLTDEERAAFLAICEKGQREPIEVGFLVPDDPGETLRYSTFLVTDLQRPTFRWGRLDEPDFVDKWTPIWADFRVELREVRPSD